MAYKPKTQRTKQSVAEYLNTITDERRRKDAKTISAIMQDITGEKPAMWGTSMVGFGTWRYKYASGTQGDWPLACFAPRKDTLTVYVIPGFPGYEELMGKLGKYKNGVSCIHFKSLDDIHVPTLKKLVRQSIRHVQKMEKQKLKG